ncbi:diaminobutyrate--2-oxoglutarate transaminase [Maritimibacter dapengensis]|uniref:Diaminobutyrate--2-oxoglutarate transaminase n=1 Tax=Maritimibacter dapengensis TaxID=2836868 RepID=A0ABS6T570_9RHOB|nr:diaminobutyrate--2-oxoglutarate transaminase [Maritimibacter dapengensis]MBV7380330.1 diaminobutyrate--2-oxoglutarate transaminase [Maritimibacter dapengensis]
MTTEHTSAINPIFARRESEARSYCRGFPTTFTKAQGSIMTGDNGVDYIDFLAGCSSLNYGHNDPDMKEALVEHITADGIAHGLDMYTDEKARFLEAFEKIVLKPRGMENYKVMMTGPTGTNAVEAAMKLARKITGRRNIISFTNGFHGMTMGSLSLTGNAGKRGGAGGGNLGDVTHLPYEGSLGDVDTLALIEAMLNNSSSGIDAPAAFIFEPVQGEGGLNAASKEWVEGIARLAKEHGAMLIVDDIQAGIGRTGTYFSTEAMDIEPDMITQAKSLSGFGLPFAALLIKQEHDVWKPAEHNGTFRGNTHAFVTARVALDKFWADNAAFEKAIAEKADILEAGLTKIADLVDGAYLKGRGFMRGVNVGTGDLAEDICARAFEKGLIIETSGADDEVVKVLAALTIPNEVLERGLDILLDATRDALADNQTLAAE